MLEEIIEILASQLSLSVDDITLDSDITGDLGADSLDIVELADKFENRFSVSVTDEEIMSIKTVSDILTYLENNSSKVQKSDI